MDKVPISTKYITLGQFLKLANCISTGSHAKIMLVNGLIKVNNESETRRGRKLYVGDIIDVGDQVFFCIVASRGNDECSSKPLL